MMPPAGGEYRAEQMTVLSGMIHQRRTDPRVRPLARRTGREPLGRRSAQRHGHDHPPAEAASTTRRVKLPQSLVEELTRTAVLGQSVWQKARRKNDFAAFRPLLEKTFELKRQEAEALGYPECPYDALLDDYEPEALTSEVAAVLADLRDELVPLVGEIGQSGRQAGRSILARQLPDRPAGGVRPRGGRADRLRLRPRPARRDRPSVLHRPGPERLPHHHALQRALLHRGVLRHPARGRPRHLRPGAAGRPVRPAAGRGRLAGHPRVAVAAVGEPRRPQPRLLAALLPRAQAAVPRGPGRRARWTTSTSPSTTCGRR